MLVVGGDRHAEAVAVAVARAGGAPVRADLGACRELSVDDDGNVTCDDVRLDPARAIYVKSVSFVPPVPSADDVGRSRFRDWRDKYTAARERLSLAACALKVLDDGTRTVVNPVRAFELHLQKPWQSALLKRAGLRVPETLATSSPREMRAFVERQRHAIYKPLSGGATAKLFVAEVDLARTDRVVDCPVLLQERVGARVLPSTRASTRRSDEWRVYVLDGDIVGAFAVPVAGVVDARENLHRARAARPPRDVERAATKAARALGLVFSGVDIRVDDEGPVILEANPTPAIEGYEDPTHSRIVDALATYLVASA